MRRHVASTRRLRLAALLVAAFVAALLVVPAGALMVSPAMALVVLLALGWFPSDELIRRIARRLRRPRRSPVLPARRPVEPLLARRGAVLAFALAVRPPPAAAPLA